MFRLGWAFAALTIALRAQPVVPGKAGLVSYADEAQIENRAVNGSSTEFYVHDNAVLRVGGGHAEVLLGPCAAMWLEEKSSFRMISSALSDVRLEALTGSVVVATGSMSGDSKLTVLLGTSTTTLHPAGVYRFDSDPPGIEALAGKATVEWGQHKVVVTAGKRLWLERQTVRKVRLRTPDQLEVWADARAALLSRMSSQPTPLAREPAPPGIQRDPLDHTKNVPGLEGSDPTTLMRRLPPLPNPTPSGCSVAPWIAGKR